MEWQYSKINDDVFILSVRGLSLQELPESKSISAMKEKLAEKSESDTRQVMNYDDEGNIISSRPLDAPHGPIHKPSAWAGKYEITVPLRIQAIYAFPNFFGLVCNTDDGYHDSVKVQQWVDDLNKGIA